MILRAALESEPVPALWAVRDVKRCDPRNRSTYNAGTLKLQQRFTNGLQFLVSYTYGKALDYGGSAASGGGAVGGGQTVTNMDAWHGPSGYDVRHRAVVSYVYQLPFGQGRRWMSDAGGVIEGIIGGWQLSGITTMTTGRPFTVFLQSGVNNGAPSWPNRVGSGKLEDPSVDLWFNPADFVAPPANTYGDSGRVAAFPFTARSPREHRALADGLPVFRLRFARR